MPDTKRAELHTAFTTPVAAARAITENAAAEGRDFTDDERQRLTDLLADARTAKSNLIAHDDDARMRSAIAALGEQIGAGAAAPSYRDAAMAQRSRWAKSTVERIEKIAGDRGAKALLSGSIDVPQPVETGIITMPAEPTRVLDLITDRVPLSGTNTFSYLRQTARTDNAAPVADNAVKPTSTYTVAEVEGRCRVIAHLSEAIPRRYLDDHVELADFLEAELERGLLAALEDQVVAGDGTGENFTGLLNTSGALTQAYSSDLFTTARKAQTALTNMGERATAWVLNPDDAEAIDLLTDGMERHYYDGPRQVLTTAPLWSAPVVQSLAVPEGTALLADWRQVRLVVREEPRLDLDQSGELFTRNQVKLRVEGRFGLAVRRTPAIVKVDLTP